MHPARIDSLLKNLFSLGILVFAVSAGCGGDEGPAGVGQGPAAPVQVTTTGGGNPTVSPDGSSVAYRYPGGGIARVPSSGGAPDTLTTFGTEPDWSSALDLIVFRYGPLFTVHPATKDTAFVGGLGVDSDPTWSPLGNEIAARTTTGGGDGIVIVSYADGDTSRVACSEAGGGICEGEGPTWSPDGQWIAFEDGLEILKVLRSGGVAEEVVHSDQDVTEPSWSPNGQWIAFVMGDSTNYQNTHIWVVSAEGEGSGLFQVTAGTVQDRDPAWSPDSRTIYFSSTRSGDSEIWRVAFDQ